jgi:hypothetical protein
MSDRVLSDDDCSLHHRFSYSAVRGIRRRDELGMRHREQQEQTARNNASSLDCSYFFVRTCGIGIRSLSRTKQGLDHIDSSAGHRKLDPPVASSCLDAGTEEEVSRSL